MPVTSVLKRQRDGDYMLDVHLGNITRTSMNFFKINKDTQIFKRNERSVHRYHCFYIESVETRIKRKDKERKWEGKEEATFSRISNYTKVSEQKDNVQNLVSVLHTTS